MEAKQTVNETFRPSGAIENVSHVELEHLRREIERLRVIASHDKGLLDAVLHHSPHGIIVCDAEGKLTLHNRASERIWAGSATAESTAEWGQYRAFHPDGRPYAAEDWAMARCLRAGEVTEAEEVHFQRFDGTHGTILGSCAPIFDGAGRLTGALSVFADITRFKEMEAAFAELTRKSAERSERLLAMTIDLSRTLTQRDAANVLLQRGLETLRVDAGVLGALAQDGRLEVLARAGATDGIEETLHSLLAEAIETRTARIGANLGAGTFAVAPLLVDDRPIGAVSFHYRRMRRFDSDDIALLTTLAAQGAQAFERARLYESEREARQQADEFLEAERAQRMAAEIAQERTAFLLEASVILSSSFDYASTIARLVHLAVPRLADSCIITTDAKNGPKPLSVEVHLDASRAGLLPALRDGLKRALTEAELLSIDTNPQLGELGLTSLLSVPVASREQQFGSIVLLAAESGRRFGPPDLEIAEFLGQRIGVAIDNAMLLTAEARARATAERNVERIGQLQAATAALADAFDEDTIARITIGVIQKSTCAREVSLSQRNSEETWSEGRACIPLIVEGDVVGTLEITLPEHEEFAEDDRAFLKVVARECAQALHRARLDLAERRARERLQLLSEASVRLAVSLDWEATLHVAADLVLGPLADWCVIDVFSEAEGIRRSVVRHRDAAKVELSTRLFASSNSSSQAGALIPADDTDANILAPEDPELVRALDIGGFIVVPLAVQDRTFGALSLIRTKPAGRYDDGERALIQELSRRVALAIDNARLYKAEKLARDTAQEAERALKEADRRKNQFLAMLAHELRNPLAPIRNAVHLLKLEDSQRPPLQRAKEIIDRQVVHMTRMIDDLLEISRITRSKVLLQNEALDLVALVRNAVDDHRAVLCGARLSLELIVPDEPIWTVGDPTRLSQVVGNLLNNTVKFTDPGGRVTVVLSGQDDLATFVVRDTGIGLSPDVLEQIFEPFSQADRSLARTRGGLGIGLALVRGLIELHGGTVHATSAGPGCGAEFTVVLPISAPREETAEMTTASTKRPLRVLVVEDNEDAAEMLAALLEFEGHTVQVERDGLSGVESGRSFRPHVVLCDIGLPGIDGYQVAKAFREDVELSAAHLVALTGYGQEEDRVRARQAGFDVHLTKPVAPRMLEEVLEQITRKRALR